MKKLDFWEKVLHYTTIVCIVFLSATMYFGNYIRGIRFCILLIGVVIMGIFSLAEYMKYKYAFLTIEANVQKGIIYAQKAIFYEKISRYLLIFLVFLYIINDNILDSFIPEKAMAYLCCASIGLYVGFRIATKQFITILLKIDTPSNPQ